MTKRSKDVPAGEEGASPDLDDQKDSEMPGETQLAIATTPEGIKRLEEDKQIIAQYRENLAHNMRRFRARERWTQTDLGKAIGSSQGQIAFLEREKQNVGLGILTKLAKAFNVEPMVLISPPDDIDEYFMRRGLVNTSRASVNPQRDTVENMLKERFYGSQTPPTPPVPETAVTPVSTEVPPGLPSDPLNLAVMARLVGAAHKRIESLRQKHGSVSMTQAMLNSVLAAVLNASHDMDEGGGTEGLALPEVEE